LEEIIQLKQRLIHTAKAAEEEKRRTSMSNSRQSGKKQGFGKSNKGAETIKFPGTKFTATTSTQNPLIPLG
jgi:hypothetical protein